MSKTVEQIFKEHADRIDDAVTGGTYVESTALGLSMQLFLELSRAGKLVTE